MRIGLLVLLAAGVIAAQTPPPQQTITVTKDSAELAAENEIGKGELLTNQQNHAEAVKVLEAVLKTIRANASLKKLEPRALVRLGFAYLPQLKLEEAGRAFTPVLDAASNCRPKTEVLLCADAQYGLGAVHMYKSDFPPAATLLAKSLVTYRAASAAPQTDEGRWYIRKQQPQVEALLGAAQFRAGDKPKAIETFRRAIDHFTRLDKDAQLPDNMRGPNHAALADAQHSLELLLQN